MRQEIQKNKSFLFYFSVVSILLASMFVKTPAQGGFGDRTGSPGTGGNHSIHGRIRLPSDFPASSIRIKLESTNAVTLSGFSDNQGAFFFNNLEPGNYTVIIDAGEEYEQIRETVTINRETLSSLSRTYSLLFYLRAKNNQKTKAGVINASLARVPEAALDQFKKALKAIEKNNTKAAIERLNEAIRLYPQFAEAYAELGSLYLKTGEIDKASESLSRSLALNDKNLEAKLNYGIILLNKRKMVEAEKTLSEVVKTVDSAPVARMYLGIALIGLNKIEEAEKQFKQAISIKDDADLAQAHRYLGGIYWSRKDYRAAADELEKYLTLAPKSPDAEKIRATVKQLREMVK